MPPMISDDESSGSDVPDEIPARPAPANAEPEDDDEEDSDDEEGEEYKVEKILRHDFTEEGVTIYQIKWLGYNKKADLTWEPIENLENAPDIIEAYHAKLGGAPVFEAPAPKSSANKGGRPKGKRSAADAFEDSPAPTSGRKRKAKSNGASEEPEPKHRKLPAGSWDDAITRVASIVEDDDKTGKGGKVLIGLLEWNDGGNKTQHNLQILRTKCPQRLLDYYEGHLKFEEP